MRKEIGHLLEHLHSGSVEERERTTCFVPDILLNSNPKATQGSEGFIPFFQKLFGT